jgi:hypothetical protein
MIEPPWEYEGEECVPSNSKELLAKLLGAVVTELVRYSWWPAAESAKECNIPNESVFSLTAGPLLITLQSGLVLSVGSMPHLISVILTVERDESGRFLNDEPAEDDDELHPINAADPVYSSEEFRRLVGKRVTSIHVLRREPKDARWTSRPREVGVVLGFDSGGELILSHGLHDGSDDFSVITRNQIDPDLVGKLCEIPLADLVPWRIEKTK